MSQTTALRKPSGKEKALIVALALYAIAVVGLDTFRPVLHGGQDTSWPLRWYPLATLGMEADNDGNVITVDADGPAAARGIQPGQKIELSSVQPDRRAINKFVYVAHGKSYTMRVISGPNAPFEVTVPAADERIEGWNKVTLLVAQASALFFIALCIYLVWHSATWSTWGFFLYGMWFNSGQYFVWYANLPTVGLIIFDALQAVMQALALTGFLAFAMHFPEEAQPRWIGRHRLYLLGGVWGVLFVSGLAGFLNFMLGWATETPYRIYYGCTLIVYFLAAWSFLHNYRRLPEQRPRMRWIMAAGLIGLPCFLLADMYEATALLRSLPFGINDWIRTHDWVLNLMYGCNVLLPAAVVYTALHREVMNVRFGITRAVILSAVFLVAIALVDRVANLPIETLMMERDALKPFAVPLSFLLAVGLALVHNPLHGAVERVCAPRWYRARRRLEELAQQLEDDDEITIADVDRALVGDTAIALWLKYAALFHRQADGVFLLKTNVNWPDGAKQTLCADDPWICSVTNEPLRLADPDEARREPALAVPIVRRVTRHPVSRLVIYGHHLTREQIDPDEIRILGQVSRAAAFAYRRLEAEAAADAGKADLHQGP